MTGADAFNIHLMPGSAGQDDGPGSAGARLCLERHSIPVIDVTRRSIGETAAAIRMMIRKGAQPA